MDELRNGEVTSKETFLFSPLFSGYRFSEVGEFFEKFGGLDSQLQMSVAYSKLSLHHASPVNYKKVCVSDPKI